MINPRIKNYFVFFFLKRNGKERSLFQLSPFLHRRRIALSCLSAPLNDKRGSLGSVFLSRPHLKNPYRAKLGTVLLSARPHWGPHLRVAPLFHTSAEWCIGKKLPYSITVTFQVHFNSFSIRAKRASESKEKLRKREMRWKENKGRKKLGLWEQE